MQLLPARGLSRIVQSLTTDADAATPSPVSDCTIPITLAVVNRVDSNFSTLFYTPDDMSQWNVAAAIGNPDQPPASGTFTLTFGANTTTALQFNATASAVSVALNLLASIIAAGGVTVASNSQFYIVTFVSNGNQSQISGDGTGLEPISTVESGTPVDGTASTAEVQTIRLLQSPAAFVNLDPSSITANTSATAVITQVGGGGLNEHARVTLAPQPYSGQWTMLVGGVETSLLNWDAAASDVQTAVEALSTVGAGNVSVSRSATSQWLFGFQGTKANTDMGTITAANISLAGIRYLAGTLELRTPGIALLFAGNTSGSVQTSFQLRGTRTGGSPEALFGPVPITLLASVITNASLTPQPVNLYYTQAQVDALIAGVTSTFKPLVTGYVGGGSTKLDGQTTVGVTVPALYQFVHPTDGLQSYDLITGTNATSGSAPYSYIRPTDYNASTNTKVFVHV